MLSCRVKSVSLFRLGLKLLSGSPTRRTSKYVAPQTRRASAWVQFSGGKRDSALSRRFFLEQTTAPLRRISSFKGKPTLNDHVITCFHFIVLEVCPEFEAPDATSYSISRQIVADRLRYKPPYPHITCQSLFSRLPRRKDFPALRGVPRYVNPPFQSFNI